MSDQPTQGGAATPPHGTPSVGDPTVATPAPGPGPGEGSPSVFGGDDPTVAVPPVPGPGEGTPPPGPGEATPPPGGGSDGPEGPDDPSDGGDGVGGPWYMHPAAITAAALLGIGAIVVILIVALGGDDDSGSTTTSTTSTSTTTTSTTSTTVATTESRCRAGDQGACDEFSDDQLDLLCADGVTSACQVLLSRQGDGDPDPDPTVPPPAPSDSDLCRQGDGPACSRLSDSQVDSLCSDGVQAACAEADARFEQSPFARCERDEADGCMELDDDGIVVLCPDVLADPDSEACKERVVRGI